MMPLYNADDYRARAKRYLPKGLFEYIDRGTEAELALSDIRQSLDKIKFNPTVLTGQSTCDMTSQMLGRRYAVPLVIAPTALAGLVSHDGEAKLARVAGRLGIPFCVSTQSVTSIDDIRHGAPGTELWLQLYLWRNRDLSWQLLDRARQSDVDTLVITADTPVSPKRDYNERNGFSVPFVPSLRGVLDMATHPRWMASVMVRYLMTSGMPTYAHYPDAFKTAITRATVAEDVKIESALGWSDVAEIRDRWQGKVILKGVLSVQDAIKARDAGIDGIVVSAHGGRNLDVAPAPVDVLPGIVGAVGADMAVMADSGVRRGSDALKYLALGSQSVLVGRLPLYGLAARGEAGAYDILAMLIAEMQANLVFAGVTELSGLRDAIIS